MYSKKEKKCVTPKTWCPKLYEAARFQGQITGKFGTTEAKQTDTIIINDSIAFSMQKYHALKC